MSQPIRGRGGYNFSDWPEKKVNLAEDVEILLPDNFR